MAIQGSGLQFNPVYWVYHDQWRYYHPSEEGPPVISHHFGHAHLFMMGFDFGQESGNAFSGSMNFRFSLQDIWGPRSDDPNQQSQYRVVGTPKWYFRVTEVWRRVYIQPWDTGVVSDNILDKRGVRYDASDQEKVHGPFREGRGFTPLWMQHARTLPVEYHTDSELGQDTRENLVHDRAQLLLFEQAEFLADLDGETLSAEDIYATIYNPTTWDLQHDAMIIHTHPASVPSFSDALYIWPLIEYQEVVQLDWDVLPWKDEDIEDIEDANSMYGDGWDIVVPIPFASPTGEINSPFCPTPGDVRPAGEYFGTDAGGSPLIALAKQMKFATVTYCTRGPGCDNPYTPPMDQDPDTSGEPIVFHNPYADRVDGRWVQQCLGGKVEAKAKIIIEHKLGGRQEVWVHATQYVPATPFAGTEQLSAI